MVDIQKSSSNPADGQLKTLPQHFKEYQNSGETVLKVKGIDKNPINQRGGNWRRYLAQLETKFILRLDTIHLKGLKEVMSFVPFL